jgi:hypothetical protein
MKIPPVTTPAVPQPLQTNTPITPNTPGTVASETSADSFAPAQNERLVNMLQQQPDVRPDAVERAKSLIADPNYPGTDAIAGLAKLFIADAGGGK